MFDTFFYEPIYNLLVLVLTYVPAHDIGAAILVVTLIVKAILLPLNMSMLRGQYAMKRVEGEIKEIREKYKDSPKEAGMKTMEVYKREKINPFASLFNLLIQIPVIIALYLVFSKGFKVDPESLYSFISFPDNLNTIAFGIFDVTKRNVTIAVLAGISSYILARRQTQSMVVTKKPGEETLQDQFMKSMRVQLLYILPIIIGFSAAIVPAALGFYWFISSVIGYFQDVYMKWKLSHLEVDAR
jgi:YidC/Oxa1 family membrane protein insertase